jgi:hypothetical protein
VAVAVEAAPTRTARVQLPASVPAMVTGELTARGVGLLLTRGEGISGYEIVRTTPRKEDNTKSNLIEILCEVFD